MLGQKIPKCLTRCGPLDKTALAVLRAKHEGKSNSRSAFITHRVLVGVSVLAGVFTLPLLFLLGNSSSRDYAAQPEQKSPQGHTGTLEKMIVASGSVAMDVDLNQLNGNGSATQKLETLYFTVTPNSFFTILVFNNAFRGVQFRSAMEFISQRPSPGFFVQKPKQKLGHPTIDWKHFGGYVFQQKDYKTSRSGSQYFVDRRFIGQIHDNNEPKKDSEPIANSNESNIPLDTAAFLIVPASQSWTFENQFVISASESDWIATDSVLIHDKGLAYKEGEFPETRVENIAVALRRGLEIAPKSSPPSSNAAPR
jgi:hypothetical protein